MTWRTFVSLPTLFNLKKAQAGEGQIIKPHTKGFMSLDFIKVIIWNPSNEFENVSSSDCQKIGFDCHLQIVKFFRFDEISSINPFHQAVLHFM